MKRREVLVAGVAGLTGCMAEMDRSGENETPPAVDSIEFRNFHDQGHELGVAFTADGEALYSHTATLDPHRGDAVPSSTVRPEVPRANWLLHGRIDGAEPGRAIPQGRIEYARIRVLCRVSPDGVLDLRVNSGERQSES